MTDGDAVVTTIYSFIPKPLFNFLNYPIIGKLINYTKIIVGISLSIATLGLVALYKCQNWLVYPSGLNEGRTFYDTPDSYGMKYQSVKITTSDGEVLDCFALKHNPYDKDYTNKTVLLLGPNAGNISHYLPIVEFFHKYYRYNVFVYSYRGYGKSTGSPSETGLKNDARAVLEYLANDKQYYKSSIILYGRSLGGAVAIYITSLTSKYWNNQQEEPMDDCGLRSRKNAQVRPDTPKFYPRISCVILENTFLCLEKVIPYIFPVLKNFSKLCTQKWRSEKEILNSDPKIPFLFLSGLKDEIVPPYHMQQLYELSPSDNKFLKTFKKGYHNNTCNQADYWQILHSFIQKNVDPKELD
ncbi:hypothetical protein DASC09_036100 [Saccharomycopsis crataegensis]|uniref:Serine aminopeptidase S33 domain-containing protein n=1 Tax=Saccharomycopsis crataegensis TaxID=43959 RepID=A0AAV5QP01_9ASCO|nr:hypothetical protein DASC09_036100 [Saccharomycopsis crataegensis]